MISTTRSLKWVNDLQHEILKSGAKKIGHVFCSADQEISLLALKWITKGQNNLFQALK